MFHPAATAKQMRVARTASCGFDPSCEGPKHGVVLSPVPQATQGSVTGSLLPSGQSLGSTVKFRVQEGVGWGLRGLSLLGLEISCKALGPTLNPWQWRDDRGHAVGCRQGAFELIH